MDRDTMFEAAAHAAIQERRREMATAGRATDADKQLKRAIRATWALGDYHRFATSLVWEVGIFVYASLADEPDRAAARDREFLDFGTRSNRGAAAGPAEYPDEYLLLIAHRRNG